MTTDELAKLALKGTYGGPSLSFDGKDFIVYKWFDAPVSKEILGRGATVKDALWDAYKRYTPT